MTSSGRANASTYATSPSLPSQNPCTCAFTTQAETLEEEQARIRTEKKSLGVKLEKLHELRIEFVRKQKAEQ